MLVRRFLVPIPAIAYVRMIVEAYEGLAVVVSPERRRGLVEWWIAPGRELEAEILARALGVEVRLQEISENENGQPATGSGQRAMTD